MDDEILFINNKIKRLKKTVNMLKCVSLVVSLSGAVVTSIFTLSNNLKPSIVSLVSTLTIAFFIDLVRKILNLTMLKRNKERNKLILISKNFMHQN